MKDNGTFQKNTKNDGIFTTGQIALRESRKNLNDKVCVIVPAKGDCEILGKCVDSIVNLDYSPFEIVIVNDGLTPDALAQVVPFRDKIKILDSRSRGPSYARNLAAQNTDAGFLAFTDSDCLVDKNWLKELKRGLEAFGDEFIGCGGVQELPFDASFFEKKVFTFIKKAGIIADYGRDTGKGNLKEVKHNASCNVMYRRDALIDAGGFRDGLWPSEDVDLDYRLVKKGYRLAFNPSAVAYHYRPKNFKSFARMMFRYGASAVSLIKRYGFFRPVYWMPLLTVSLSAFLILGISSNLFPLYLMIIFISSSALFAYLQFDFWLLKLALAAVFYWHLGFLMGFWHCQKNERIIKGNQRAQRIKEKTYFLF